MSQMMELNKVNFVVVDVETTGLYPQSEAITEIAMYKICDKKIVDKWCTLINPEKSIPLFITLKTGISDAMVFDKPTASQIAPKILEFIGDSVFVAHNADFDFGFVNSALNKSGIKNLTNSVVCTVKLARIFLPHLPKKNLDYVSNAFGIKTENRHRADSDAHTTAIVLIKFLDIWEKENGIKNLDEFLKLQKHPATRKYF